MKPDLHLQFFQRSRCGVTEYEFLAERFFETAHQSFGRQFRPAFMRGADRDQDSVFEWRKIAAFPKLQFLLEVAREIVMPRKLDRGTKRRVSLDENFARRFTATCPARDLGE